MRFLRIASLAVILSLTIASCLRADPRPVNASEMAAYDQGFATVQADSRTFRADLRQTLSLQGLARPITSIGSLFYASPDRLFIRFSQPAGEWMLVNGSQVAIQKQGRPLETRDLSGPGKNSSHEANLLDVFHSDPSHWHRDFDVRMTRDGSLLYVHLKPWMTPTSSVQGVDGIVTTLKLPGYDLLDISISINAQNRIDYAFTNPRRNVPLDPAPFKMPNP